MRELRLDGHYGGTVELDLCEPCHLVWFDKLESAGFGGAALLTLIGAMAQAQTLPHLPLRKDAACPRCRGPLKTVHNRTRWGPSLQLECRRGHGAWQTFAEFLGERGLVRAMSSADRAGIVRRSGRLDCLNCGAPVGSAEASCSHCRAVPALFDIARMARALDPEGAAQDAPALQQAARATTRQCLACGAALPTEPSLRCPQCDATLAVARLDEALAHLAPLGPSLRAPGTRPPKHVVQARIRAQSADLPRRRAWAAQMQAEADAERGGAGPAALDGRAWAEVAESIRAHPWRWALGACGALLLLWLV